MLEKIKIERTAHYYVQLPKKEVKSVLFVIHGYAQRAEDFINEFRYLENSNTLVIAPEALSLFYNKNREPVASWMTSRHREDEIKDYIGYLNALHDSFKGQYNFEKTAVLGFSQGVSTSFRWLSKMSKNKVQYFACSGSVPPELKKTDFKDKNIKIDYFFGDQDKLITPEQAEKNQSLLKLLEIDYEAHPFSGRHEVSEKSHQLIRHWALND